MIDETITEGGCLCGAVRYRTIGAPRSACICHCTLCRRAVGSMFVSWATFPEDSFEITKGNLTFFKSSEKAERGLCGACGTPLTFRHDRNPGLVDVATATADDPGAWVPTHHIWTSSRLPGIHANDELPAYPESPPDA